MSLRTDGFEPSAYTIPPPRPARPYGREARAILPQTPAEASILGRLPPELADRGSDSTSRPDRHED